MGQTLTFEACGTSPSTCPSLWLPELLVLDLETLDL